MKLVIKDKFGVYLMFVENIVHESDNPAKYLCTKAIYSEYKTFSALKSKL
jgi:hypothetical protein